MRPAASALLLCTLLLWTTPAAAAVVSDDEGQQPTILGIPLGGQQESSGLRTPNDRMSKRERVRWFVDSTVGPQSLGAGVLSAAWGTAVNDPKEYRGTWSGFGKRYAVRFSGVAIGNGLEAGLGAVWGEDTRYTRSRGRKSPWMRVMHAGRMTVLAPRLDGTYAPAYARYAGIAGNNFITNAWRADSESSVNAALIRTALGFAGRFGSNVFQEFWPDMQRRFFGRPPPRGPSRPRR
jgi:hypothetical protein